MLRTRLHRRPSCPNAYLEAPKSSQRTIVGYFIVNSNECLITPHKQRLFAAFCFPARKAFFCALPKLNNRVLLWFCVRCEQAFYIRNKSIILVRPTFVTDVVFEVGTGPWHDTRAPRLDIYCRPVIEHSPPDLVKEKDTCFVLGKTWSEILARRQLRTLREGISFCRFIEKQA